jgi:hypothetical protein
VAEAIDNRKVLQPTNLISTDLSNPLPPLTTNRNHCRRHTLKMKQSRCELLLIKTLLRMLHLRTDNSPNRVGVEARSTSHHNTGTIHRIKSHHTKALKQPSSWWRTIIRAQNLTQGEVNTTLTLSNSIETPVRQAPPLVIQRAHTLQIKCRVYRTKNSLLSNLTLNLQRQRRRDTQQGAITTSRDSMCT